MKHSGSVCQAALGVALACMLAFAGLPLGRVAQAETGNITPAMDLVILIDDSNSMFDKADHSGEPGSDPDQYRKEAAAIMLNMCEMSTSRVAVVSFGSKPQDIKPASMDYENGLISISGAAYANRAKLTAAIKGYKKDHTDTDVRAALKHAVELFTRTPTLEGNQRVILLLTDGRPFRQLNESESSKISYTRGEDEAMEYIQQEPLLQKGAENGIRVYTVVLDVKEKKQGSVESNVYTTLAEQTGGAVLTVDEADALPAAFTDLLARQIGSRPLSDQVKPVSLDDGRIGLSIRIPNQSVQEVNLLLSTSTIQPESVQLCMPAADGQEIGETAWPDGRTLLYNSTNNFVQYKIAKPKVFGNWWLVYRPLSAANTAKSAAVQELPARSLTVVFSYDLNLTAALTAPQEDLTQVHKNDQLTLNAWFEDGAHQRSRDPLLYQATTTDAQGNPQGIGVKVCAVEADQAVSDELFASRGVALTAGTQGGGGFTLTFRPADLGITKAGAYKLYLRADGDGLLRDLAEPIAITVVNRKPVFPEGLTLTLRMNDPGRESMGGTVSEVLTAEGMQGVCYDADGDCDATILTAMSLNEALVRVEDDPQPDQNVTLVAVGGGTGAVRMAATDNEGAPQGRTQFDLPVTVVDQCAVLRERYLPVVSPASAAGSDGTYPIQTAVPLVLHMTDLQPALKDELSAYDLEPSLTAVWDDGETQTLACTPAPNGNGWTAVLDSGMTSRSVRLNASVRVGLAQNQFRLAAQQATVLQVGNPPPVPAPDAAEAIPETLWIEQARVMKGPIDEGRTVALANSFTDVPGDRLTYAAYVLPGDAPIPAMLADAAAQTRADDSAFALTVAEDGTLTLNPRQPGTYLLAVGATDAAGQTALFTRRVTVQSRLANENKAIQIISLILGVLAALALGIVFVTRPSFGGKAFELQRGGKSQAVRNLQNTKGKLMLSSYPAPFANGEMSGPVGSAISAAGACLSIKPGRRHPVRVKLTAPLRNGVVAKLNGKVLKVGGWNPWDLNELLTLEAGQTPLGSLLFGWKLIQSKPTTAARRPQGPGTPGAGPSPYRPTPPMGGATPTNNARPY
ncbi:MAG: vWA domain-containing protein [Candidatus Limiplasma sp.]|nr:vWA domain-containing protein [Candidatus Limiplasma sp.]